LVDAVDQGMIDPKNVVTMCMSYMSEFQVMDMCQANDIMSIDPAYSDDDEDDEDSDND
jgi:hypothetical protein